MRIPQRRLGTGWSTSFWISSSGRLEPMIGYRILSVCLVCLTYTQSSTSIFSILSYKFLTPLNSYPAHDSKGDPKDHITVSIKGKQENLLVGRPEIVDVETKYTTPTGEKKSSKNWHIYTNRIVD